jgi:hypothetical protein
MFMVPHSVKPGASVAGRGHDRATRKGEGMGQGRKRNGRAAWMGLLSALAMAFAAMPAGAAVHPVEVEEYMRDFDVSAQRAEAVLGVQARAAEVDLGRQLEDRLDEDYAGIWFQPDSGEYVVPVTAGPAGATVSDEMTEARLAGDYRTRLVEFSWGELEAAQDELNQKLGEFLEAGVTYTSLDPRTNAAVLHVAADASGEDRAAINRIAKGVGDEVELRSHAENRFGINSQVCNPWGPPGNAHCGTPFRGGVAIDYFQSPKNGKCTAGFRAIGDNGRRYVITAGHCVLRDIFNPDFNDPISHWQAWDVGQPKYLGQVTQISPFPSHDWAKIDATATEWDTWNSPQGWPSMVVGWGTLHEGEAKMPGPIDEEYEINAEARTITGQTVCLSGIATGSSCGQVVETDVSKLREGGMGHDLVKVANSCNYFGDSGGPWFFANTAYGIHNAGDGAGPCQGHAYYQEITDATSALGVSVAPRVSSVSIDATPLNGNPGWVTLEGEVTAPGTTVTGKKVNIELSKWSAAANAWQLQATLQGIDVSNGKYKVENWQGVGPGNWIAKAVFPAQAPFTEASSDVVAEGNFEIKDGYRIKARHSGKCLDVHAVGKDNGEWIQQWDCGSPISYQHQVFTMVPQGGGYFQLRARHSGRCLDVLNGSPSDAAPLQQYTCGPQANQSWRGDPADSGYSYLVAKHSSKCIDVTGGATGNGVAIKQWSCNGSAHQKFTFQSVDSAPVPTTTNISIPGEETLHGEPGYMTVQGYVKTGAYGVGGRKVRIHYRSGATYRTEEVTLNSEGFYRDRYEKLGKGTWEVWAQFLGADNGGANPDPDLAPSESPIHSVTIKSGYRFVFRHSNKCMSLANGSPANTNGFGIIQWGCSLAPNPNDGQVFTLIPWADGYFQIEINKTDRCLDVTAASTNDGTPYQQWACHVPPAGQQPYNHQLFYVMPMQGTHYKAFVAKHSGKCADVQDGSSADGKRIQQWACHWGANQQWQFEPIN